MLFCFKIVRKIYIYLKLKTICQKLSPLAFQRSTCIWKFHELFTKKDLLTVEKYFLLQPLGKHNSEDSKC